MGKNPEKKLEALEDGVSPEDWEAFTEHFGEPQDREIVYKGVPDKEKPAGEGKRKVSRADLNVDEIKVLESINRDPCSHLTRRAEVLGVPAATMNRIKERLRNKELIEQTRATIGGTSGTYHWLTEQGRRVLGQLGGKPKPIHGNLQHFCLILQLERVYAREYETQVDKWFGQLRPDIWCVKRDRERYETGAVEVVESAHTATDLKKIRWIASRADWVHVYFSSENNLRHYRNTFRVELPQELFAKISFRQLG